MVADSGYPTGTQSDRGHAARDGELSVAELVKQLSEQSAALARKEIELAKLEIAQKAKRTGIGAGMFGGAGILGTGAFGALTACFILALNLAVPAWAAALMVTGIYAAVAGALVVSGKANLTKGSPPAPTQAVDSTKEDVEWVRHRARSAKA